MPDKQETEAELLQELDTLRRRISKLEQDIANREQAEAEIAGLANFAAENPNPVLRISEDCTILYANRASSIVLQTWQRQVGQALPEACCQRAKEALSSGKASTFEFTCDDGRIFLVTLAPMVKEGYLDAYGMDITHRKKAEGQLRQSEQKWRCLAENAPDVILTVDSNGTILFLNRTVPPYTPEEAIGTSVYDYVLPEHRETLRNAIELVMQTGEPCSCELAGMGPGRRTSWYRSRLGPIKEDGKVVALTLIATDVTEHKQGEDALQESENKYRDLVEGLTDVIYTTDAEGTVTSVNKAEKAVFGRDATEVIGRHFTSSIVPEYIPDAMAAFERVLSGESLTVQTIALDKSRRPHNIELSSSPIIKDGGAVGTRGIIRDITERKKAEKKLKENEATLRAIIDSVTESVLLIEPDGTVLAANRMTAERLGTTIDGLIGEFAYDFLPPDVAESRKLQMEKVVSTGQPVIFEDIHGARHLLHSLNPIKDSAGKVTKVAIFGFDLTERKQVEEELREARNILRRIIDMLPVRVFWKNKDSEYLGCNEAFVKDAGLKSPDEIVGKNDFELVWKDQAELYRADDKKVIETGRAKLTYEEPSTTLSGDTIWLNTSKVPLKNAEGEIIGVLGVYSDITAQKQMQDALRRSENKYKTLLENLTQKVFLKDRNSVYISCNENYARDLRIKADQIVGRTDYDFYPKELAEKYRADDRRIVESGQTTDIEEKYILEGQEFIVHTVKTPVRDEQGNVIGILGIFWDITEQKKVQEVLITRDKAIASSINAIAISDEQGILTYVNHSFLRILRYDDAKQVLGKSIIEFARDKDAAVKAMQQLLTVGSWMGEIGAVRRDGSPLQIQISASVVRDEGGRVICLMSSFVDITESKRKERELNLYREKMARAEQLASLGTLSATLAHELTQPLTTIRLSIENSLVDLEKTSSPADVIEGLEDSLDEVSHVVSIVDRLRNFARESSEKSISEIELKAVAERITHLLKRNAQQANISLRLKDLEKLPPLYVHERDMEQLFFALVDNAIHAADGKKPRRLTITGAVKEEHIELQFADNCGGIAPENLNKIFEPFFTTKPAGEGTGLGLCVVHRVVSRAGGKVWVESRPGKGATFFVTLPVRKTYES